MGFEQVENDPKLVEGEKEVLSFWDESRAFDKLREKNAGGPPWSFLDGPITANNPMGVHHAWGRTYKDLFQRYFAMRGYDQRWQNGFDCQGLWVEVQVERELGFNSKRDIEAYGLEEFVNRCKERVLKYSAIQTEQSVRLGMWMDWQNSYFTMSDENNYTIWSFLKRCHERKLIYKGMDSMPWCPRCGTGISEQERREGYKLIEDESVYVRLPLKDREREYLLVWTTTPWTLAANVAAAVHPDLTYVAAKLGEDTYYVSKGRLSVLEGHADAGAPQVIEELKGEAMAGWRYHGPFDDLPAAAPALEVHRVIEWEDVEDSSGTGIVHIAPGAGKEDFDLGKKFDLPVIAPIDESGRYEEGFGALTGKAASEVHELIYRDLEEKGLFFSSERYTHDYPHCWRCDTQLLFRAVDEWYIDMSWRDEIKEVAKQINWIPDYTLDLELDWLKNMSDWMISKKRYWGLALPIWECNSCGHFDVVGGFDELKERAVEGWDEFEGHTPHRPWIDSIKIRCEKCGEMASRIPDVGNPWLDAGIVPYSTVGYNEDREHWAKWIPADFIVEAFPGQFRNWFYALLAMSTMMEKIPPFQNCLGHMLVRDEKGEEFSKSRHFIELNEAADRASSDVMRWLFMRQNPTQNVPFGYHNLDQLSRKVFMTLWNTYRFFVNYARLDQFDPASEQVPVHERPEIDRWILSDLQLLVKNANESFPKYWVTSFMRQAEEFIEKLSNWYVRRNRPRFWDPRGKDEETERSKLAAYQTLYEVLVTLVKLLAPVIPFLSERMYQNLVATQAGDAQPISVHLADYPETSEDLIDEGLSFDMRVAQNVVATGHSLRKQSSRRVRQPLNEMRVVAPDPRYAAALERLSSLVSDELNVKAINLTDDLEGLSTVKIKPNFGSLGPRFGKEAKEVAKAIEELDATAATRLAGGESVVVAGKHLSAEDVHVHVETASGWIVGEAGSLQIALDVAVTDELIREGIARDVVRHIQNVRKEIGLNIEDRIEVSYSATPHVTAAIEQWESYIAGEAQADRIQAVEPLADGTLVNVAESEVRLSVKVSAKS
ncbi:MAG: isoleucine--tRNA ligase [Actinobacteria bacterium]|nr:isoleucine--tRNA ligase [Actinomycetota bacterium]